MPYYCSNKGQKSVSCNKSVIRGCRTMTFQLYLLRRLSCFCTINLQTLKIHGTVEYQIYTLSCIQWSLESLCIMPKRSLT